jgi:hypothetical protein
LRYRWKIAESDNKHHNSPPQTWTVQGLGLGLWCFNYLQQNFSYIVAVSFIGGGNRNTRRKPPTCRGQFSPLYLRKMPCVSWVNWILATSLVNFNFDKKLMFCIYFLLVACKEIRRDKNITGWYRWLKGRVIPLGKERSHVVCYYQKFAECTQWISIFS